MLNTENTKQNETLPDFPRTLEGVSSPQPTGHTPLRMAVNAAQHKIVNVLKPFFLCISLLVFVYLMCGPI